MSETPESPSTPFGAYRTFAEMVDDLARVKGFHQHKQLAKAVSENTKMTVLERNVSNWRRGVSLPSGPFMKPLADALGVTGHPTLEPLWHRLHGEAVAARKLLPPEEESEPGEREPEKPKRFALAPWMKWAGGGVALLVVTGGLAAAGVILTKQATPVKEENLNQKNYIIEIPNSFLRLSPDGFIIPDSDIRDITPQELHSLSAWELYIARNEIFARHGTIFNKPYSVCLQNHFNKQQWYKPLVTKKTFPSTIERNNGDNILSYECGHRGGRMTCEGQIVQCGKLIDGDVKNLKEFLNKFN